MAKSKAQLQRPPAAPEYPDLFSDLLVLFKFLGTICILYFFNTIIFLALQKTMVKNDSTLFRLFESFAILLNLLHTVSAIRHFHELSAALPNIRPLSEFLDMQQLHQRRLRGFQVFEHFRTNHMAICAIWGMYCFLTSQLRLLLIVAQIMLFLCTTESKELLNFLLLPLHSSIYIAPEGILSTWTIISYILGHCVVMANPIRHIRFTVRGMFGSTLVDIMINGTDTLP
jgi:hypothetical protein